MAAVDAVTRPSPRSLIAQAAFRSLGDTSPGVDCSTTLQSSAVRRADGVMDVSRQRGEHLGHFWQRGRVQILDLAGTQTGDDSGRGPIVGVGIYVQYVGMGGEPSQVGVDSRPASARSSI